MDLYNIKDSNSKKILINNVSEFPKAFAKAIADLINGSTQISCTGATKSDFLNSVIKNE